MNCYYGRHQNYSGQYLTMETLLKTITHVIKQCQGIKGITILKKNKKLLLHKQWLLLFVV